MPGIKPTQWLDEQIKKLTRAAIDAFVHQVVGSGAEQYSKEEGVYRFTATLTPVEESQAGGGLLGGPKIIPPRYTISRPGSDGLGGGVVTRVDTPQTGSTGEKTAKGAIAERVESTDWVQRFNEVRNRIGQAIKDWKELPTKADLASLKYFRNDLLSKVGVRLAVDWNNGDQGDSGNSKRGGSPTGESEINAAIYALEANQECMSGATWGVFQQNYICKIRTVISLNHALFRATASVVGAEHAMFSNARETVSSILDSSTAAFDAVSVPAKGSVDIKAAAKIGSAAVEAVKALAGADGPLAAGKAVKAVTDFGLAVVDAAPEDPDISKNGGNYDEVMNGFEGALSDLNARVTKTEKDLDSKLQANLNQLKGHGSDYGIAFTALDTSSSNQLKIRVEGDGSYDMTVNSITQVNLPTIASELSGVVTDLTTVKDSFPRLVNRPGSIGLGVTGPSTNFCSSMDNLIRYINELSYETTLAKHNLELAVQDLTTQDGSSKAELERVQAEVQEHYENDPNKK